MVQIINLFLYRMEHGRFRTAWLDAEEGTQHMVEFPDPHRREAEILHAVQVLVQSLGKAPQPKGLAHAGLCREHADPADLPDIGKPGSHFLEIPGLETILFFDALLIKGVKGKPIIVCKHPCHLLA